MRRERAKHAACAWPLPLLHRRQCSRFCGEDCSTAVTCPNAGRQARPQPSLRAQAQVVVQCARKAAINPLASRAVLKCRVSAVTHTATAVDSGWSGAGRPPSAGRVEPEAVAQALRIHAVELIHALALVKHCEVRAVPDILHSAWCSVGYSLSCVY